MGLSQAGQCGAKEVFKTEGSWEWSSYEGNGKWKKGSVEEKRKLSEEDLWSMEDNGIRLLLGATS